MFQKSKISLLYFFIIAFLCLIIPFNRQSEAWGGGTTTTTRDWGTGFVKLNTSSTFINQGDSVIFDYNIGLNFQNLNPNESLSVPCALYKVESDNSTSTIINFNIYQSSGTICYSSWTSNGQHEVGGFISCSGPYDQIKPAVDTKYQMACKAILTTTDWNGERTSAIKGTYISNKVEVKVASVKMSIDPPYYFSVEQNLPLDVAISWNISHVSQCQAFTLDDPLIYSSRYDRDRALKALPYLVSGWEGSKPKSGTATAQIKSFQYGTSYYGYMPFSLVCLKETGSLSGFTFPSSPPPTINPDINILDECFGCKFTCKEDGTNKNISFNASCSSTYTFGCEVDHEYGNNKHKIYFIPGTTCSQVHDCQKVYYSCRNINITNCSKNINEMDTNKCIRTEQKLMKDQFSTESPVLIIASPTHIPYNGTSSIFILGNPSYDGTKYSLTSDPKTSIIDIKGGSYRKTTYITGNYWQGGEVEYSYYKLKFPPNFFNNLSFDDLNKLIACEAYDENNEYPLGEVRVFFYAKSNAFPDEFSCRNSKSFIELIINGLGDPDHYDTLVPPYIIVSPKQDTSFSFSVTQEIASRYTTSKSGIECGGGMGCQSVPCEYNFTICTYSYDENGKMVVNTSDPTEVVGHITSNYEVYFTLPDGTVVNTPEAVPFDKNKSIYDFGNAATEFVYEKTRVVTTNNTITAYTTIFVSSSTALQVSLSANPTTVSKGATSTISYNILNASTSTPCVATSTDDVWKPNIQLDNSGNASSSDVVTLNDAKTYDFSLTCYDKTDPTKSQTATASVNVTTSSTSIILSADKNKVDVDEPVLFTAKGSGDLNQTYGLDWIIGDAKDCNLHDLWKDFGKFKGCHKMGGGMPFNNNAHLYLGLIPLLERLPIISNFIQPLIAEQAQAVNLTSTLTYIWTKDGTYNVYVQGKDLKGNIIKSNTVTITVGNAPPPTPPTCQILDFKINDRDNTQQNPLIVWVNTPLKGYFSVNDSCKSCTVSSDDTWGNPPKTYPITTLKSSYTESFKINTAGTYAYTLKCVGADPEDIALDVLSLKAVKAINLPWWREIIPNLSGFLRGMIHQ